MVWYQKAVHKIAISLCGALLQTTLLYIKKNSLLSANFLLTQKREKFVLTLFILGIWELQVNILWSDITNKKSLLGK